MFAPGKTTVVAGLVPAPERRDRYRNSQPAYICEDGLVHYCSQQRGYPAIPLMQYNHEDLLREGRKAKGCAPFCTISCVHQTAMLDEFRTRPTDALTKILNGPKERNLEWKPPAAVSALEWMFLRSSKRKRVIGAIALRVLGVSQSRTR